MSRTQGEASSQCSTFMFLFYCLPSQWSESHGTVSDARHFLVKKPRTHTIALKTQHDNAQTGEMGGRGGWQFSRRADCFPEEFRSGLGLIYLALPLGGQTHRTKAFFLNNENSSHSGAGGAAGQECTCLHEEERICRTPVDPTQRASEAADLVCFCDAGQRKREKYQCVFGVFAISCSSVVLKGPNMDTGIILVGNLSDLLQLHLFTIVWKVNKQF